MKKKLILITLIIYAASLQVYSQEVAASAGKHFEADHFQISCTLGEPVIQTLNGSNHTLTQGFHQGELVVTPVLSFTQNMAVNVYPNPTSEYINIQLNGSQTGELKARLYSLDGKLLKQKIISDEKTELQLDEFTSGYYLLKLTKGKDLLQTFKIIKR